MKRFLVCGILILSMLACGEINTASIKTVKLMVNESCQIKIKNSKNKKITYKSMNKKMVSVSKKGVIKAKKQGNCYLIVKQGNKKIKYKVVVYDKKSQKPVNVVVETQKPVNVVAETQKPVNVVTETPKPSDVVAEVPMPTKDVNYTRPTNDPKTTMEPGAWGVSIIVLEGKVVKREVRNETDSYTTVKVCYVTLSDINVKYGTLQDYSGEFQVFTTDIEMLDKKGVESGNTISIHVNERPSKVGDDYVAYHLEYVE